MQSKAGTQPKQIELNEWQMENLKWENKVFTLTLKKKKKKIHISNY